MSTKVAILNGANGAEHDVLAHLAGCQDITKQTRSGKYDLVQKGVSYETKHDVHADYNADFIAEGGEEAAWPIHFAPCLDDMPEGEWPANAKRA